MAEGRQERHAVHAEFVNFLHIQVLDDIRRNSQVLGVEKHEIRTILHAQITVLNQPGIGCNAAAGALAEHVIQADNWHDATGDDVF